MTKEEIEEMSQKRYEETVEYVRNTIKARKDKKFKFEKILNRIILWQPPTEAHVEFKERLISKIESTMSVECDVDMFYEILKRDKLDSIESWGAEMNIIIEKIQWYKDRKVLIIKRQKEAEDWVIPIIESLDLTEEEIDNFFHENICKQLKQI